MSTKSSKRQTMKAFFASHDDEEVTIHFNAQEKTGKPLAAETGLYLEWRHSDGVQAKRGSTFIFYEDIVAVSY